MLSEGEIVGRGFCTTSNSLDSDMGLNWSKTAGHIGGPEGSETTRGGTERRAEIFLTKKSRKLLQRASDGTMGSVVHRFKRESRSLNKTIGLSMLFDTRF